MDVLADLCQQRRRLSQYACQARRSRERRSRKILYRIRIALKRLDRMQDLVQAERRTRIHAE
jgi:hypothetical protein